MFSRLQRRRPTINRQQSVILLIATPSNPIHGLLSSESWLLLTAESAAEAEAGAQELTDAGQLPDLVLLELALPDGAGFDLWAKLQRSMGWSAVPCIFIGKDVDEEVILQAFEVGASDYIHPPFEAAILFEKMRVLLHPEKAKVPRRIEEVLPETIFDARYKILRRIGRGGMSEVFLVEDLSNGTRRALKLFAPKGQEESAVEQERFRREIRAQIRLRHPHLVRVYDIGFVGALYYYTMDYLSDGSLAERLKKGPLSPKKALWIAARIASALQLIHEHKLQHRDLKPGNILFSAAGDPILTDFGLVLDTLAPRLTHEEIVLGTLRYMSPERLTLEEEIDHRSDLYSLGLLLYEMLAGRLPYSSQDPLQMHRVMMAGLPPPTVYQPNIPDAAVAICQRATAYHPEDRYRDAVAMEQELVGALQAMAHGRVLLLDDDPMIGAVFVGQLESLGMECEFTQDGEEALALARSWLPDLCMFNVASDRLGAVAMYQQLRRIPHLAQTPCIFVAPRWTEETAIKAFRMGAQDCLSKPFSLRETAAKIQQWIDRAQQKLPSHSFQPRSVINGRYELIRLLHRGRQSLVYVALDRQTGRPRVLKSLQPSCADDSAAHWRLLREMAALAQCSHPHILGIEGIGRYRGLPYFIAPYVEGETLAAALRRRERLPLASALALAIRLASALDHLHCHSLLHGHLTPSNVLLSEEGQPTLADLGECRLLPSTEPFGPFLHQPAPSQQRLHRSKARYQSPELLRGDDRVDERSDLFGLGLLLYEMLTGIAPLAGCSKREALQKIEREGIPSPLKFQPYLPQAAADLTSKLLMAQPEKRFLSAALVERACLRLLREQRQR